MSLPTSVPTQTIVFIDSGVADYQSLVRGVLSGIKTIVIDRDRDGVKQITEVLNRKNFKTIHIVAHGSSGCLNLGNSQLSLKTLGKYTRQLRSWFPDNFDTSKPIERNLVLYGCNLAEGEGGQKFLTRLCRLIDANITASTTPVGHATRGGNWDLDYQTSSSNIAIPFNNSVLDWQGVLAAEKEDPLDDLMPDFLEEDGLEAEITTDLADYAPGSTAIIEGNNFESGETVELQVLHNDGTPNTGGGHIPWQVTDGGIADLDGLVNGKFQTSWYVNPDDSANSAFDLTATGLNSGKIATHSFTDSGGDFSIDFSSAAPFTYNHATGGGAYNDRTVGKSNDVVESLQGGDFSCGDIVSYFLAVSVDDAAVGSQTIEVDLSFLADSTGQSGVAHDDIVDVEVNYGTVQNGAGDLGEDTGIVDDGGSEATLVSESINGALFTSRSTIDGTVRVDDLEAGETVVVRIDTHLGCDPNTNPTGNLQGLTTGARVVDDGSAISVGNQTIPFLQVGDIAGAGDPLLKIEKTATTDLTGGDLDGVEELNVASGDTVRYLYKVTNSGTQALYDLELNDDGTAIDSNNILSGAFADIDEEGTANDLGSGETIIFYRDVTLDSVGAIATEVTATGNNDASGQQFAIQTETDLATVNVTGTQGFISGFVYDDIYTNGIREAGEVGIAGVELSLTGRDSSNRAVSLTTTTNANGQYQFTGLEPSNADGYTITQTQPDGYDDSVDAVGSAGAINSGNDTFTILLGEGEAATGYNFGEQEQTTTVSGFVYDDVNNNGVLDDGEVGIPNVEITLTGVDINGVDVSKTAITDSSGQYTFEDLEPSADKGKDVGYNIAQTANPPGYNDGQETLGTINGVEAGEITVEDPGEFNIDVVEADTAINYNFGESLIAASLSGLVVEDNNNGIGDVVITLTGKDSFGNAIEQSVTTNALGEYQFDNLRASNANGYTITQTQPNGYSSVLETVGTGASSNGIATTNQFTGIVLAAGDTATGYNFSEQVSITLPTVNLSVTPDAGSEADATVFTITATASGAVSGEQTIELDTTGLDLSDYNLSDTTITIADGETTGSVTLSVIDDSEAETDEIIPLSLINPSVGLSLGTNISTNLTIADNDSANLIPQAEADTDTSAGILDVDLATGNVNLDIVTGNVTDNDNLGDAPTLVTAAEAADGSSITLGTNFVTSEGGTLLLAADGSYVYTPPQLGLTDPGITEVFNYTITDGNGDSSDSTLTINVNGGSDILPTVNLSVTPDTGSEADATVFTITATASGAVSGEQTIELDTTGLDLSDYNLSDTTITIADGETTGSVTLSVIDDSEAETDEIIPLSLINPSVGLSLGTNISTNLTIADNDSANLGNIEYALNSNLLSLTEGDDGSQILNFTVTRTGAIQDASSVDFSFGGTATNGEDYSIVDNAVGVSGTVDFAANETSKTITLDITGDTSIEPDETIVVSLTNGTAPNGTPNISIPSVTAIILNDDLNSGADLTIGDTSATEGDPLVFDLSLSEASTGDLTLDLTTIDGTADSSDREITNFEYKSGNSQNWLDAVDGTKVTIPDGETSIQVRIDSTADNEAENDETFTLAVNEVVSGNVGGISDTGEGTIADNTGNGNGNPGNTNPGTIAGKVWNDLNLDGIRNGEDGVDGVTVNLFSQLDRNTPVATTTTGNGGNYEFTVEAGNYFVEFTTPENAVFSPRNRGGDDTIDSDVNKVLGTTQSVRVNADDTIQLDAGISPDSDGDTIPDAIEGKTGDRDKDGVPNYLDVDPAGYFYAQNTGQVLPGGSIDVTTSGTGLINITEDASETGFYQWFIDGTPDTYTMGITAPPGYIISPDRPALNPPPLDPTGLTPDPFEMGSSKNEATETLFDFTKANNPYYLEFELAADDPFIINNNIPFVAPPTLDLDKDNDSGVADPDSQITFTIGSGGVAIATDPIIGDLDNTTIESATITLTNALTGDVLTGVNLPNDTNITVDSATTDTQIRLTGTGTLDEYAATIASIKFNNTESSPDTSDRTIRVVVNDGISDSQPAISTVTFDNAPIVNLDPNNSSGGIDDGNFETIFAEQLASVGISNSNATILNPNNADFTSLTLNITGVVDGSSEILNIGGTPFGLDGNSSDTVTVGNTSFAVDITDGGNVITLTNADTGNLPKADLQELLRGITYRYNADNPTAGDRTIEIVASDDMDSTPVTSTISVQPVNDAPTITAPDAQTASEATSLPLVGIRFDDLDAGDNSVNVNLSVSNGIITLDETIANGLAAVDITDNGTASVTLTGTIDQINTTLTAAEGLEYLGNNGFTGNDELQIVINDGGNSGVDPSTINLPDTADATSESASTSIPIVVNAIAGNPAIAIANSYSTNEEIEVSGNLITDDDGGVDSGDSPLNVTGNTNPTNGTVTVAANGDFTYTPNADFVGTDSFTYTIQDADGDADTSNVSVTVNPVNDAPENTVPGEQSLLETETIVFNTANGNALTIADIDADTTTVRVTLSASNGTLTALGNIDNLDSVTGVGTNEIILEGSQANLNDALQGLTYTPDGAGNGSISITTNDLGNTGVDPSTLNLPATGSATNEQDTDTVNITTIAIAELNTPPTNTIPSPQTTGESEPGVFQNVVFSTANNNAIAIADSEADPTTDTLEITLTATNGVLNLATINNLNITAGGDNSETVTVRGTIDDLNTALEGLTYSPTGVGNGSLQIQTNDLGVAGIDPSEFSVANTGSNSDEQDTDTIDITTVPFENINQAPVNTVPNLQNITAGTNLVFSQANNNSISINDVDADSAVVEVTLTATNGSLTLASTDGLNFTAGTGSDETSMTFRGTQTNINLALEGLTFAPVTAGAGSIIVQTNDLGNSGDDPSTVGLPNTGDATNEQDIDTIDINVAEIDTYSISGILYQDDNASDTFDDGESTLPAGITVNLLDSNNKVVDTVETDANGRYQFDGTTAATYSIQIDTSDTQIPNNLTLGTDNNREITISDRNLELDFSFDLPVNNPAEAVDNSYSTNEEIEATGNLISDDNGGTDSGDGTLTVIDNTDPTNGLVTVAANGDFTYTPNENFAGTDSFTYTIEDADGDTDTASVSLTVEPVNDAPVNTVPGEQNTQANQPVVFNAANGNAISIADVDANGNLQVTLNASNGTLTIKDTANLTFDGIGTNTVTLEGLTADLNTALNGLTYTPTQEGTGAIEVQTNDLGNSGNDPSTVGLPNTADANSEQDNDTVNIAIAPDSSNGTIVSQVWSDTNFDGIQDANESSLDGVTVELFDADGNLQATDITADGGRYEFAEIVSGDYYLEFATPANYVLSPQGKGSDEAADSDVNRATGRTDIITIAPGDSFSNISAAFAPDSDGDTIPDAVEGLTGDRDNDGTPNYLDVDPAGYFYAQNTGQVLPGGLIEVSGAGAINIAEDASETGFYQWFIDGTPDTYTMSITAPEGYVISPDRLPSTPAIDATTLLPTDPFEMGSSKDEATGTLFDFTETNNPYYLEFELAADDPFIINNNIPFVAPPTLDLDNNNDSGAVDPNTQTTFTTGSGGVAIASDPIISDLDGNNIESATITLTTRPDGNANESLTTDGTLPNGITANYVAATGELTLSGSGSLENYQTAISQINYNNTAVNDTSDRTVNVVLNDGDINSNVATSTIAVSDVPAVAPSLDLDGDNDLTGNDFNTSYSIGGSPISIANNVLIEDSDSTNLMGASIYLKTRPDGDAAESLIVNGDLPPGITSAGFDDVTGAIELSGDAPLTAYQTAIAQIEYTNTIGLMTDDRLVEVTLSDGISNSNIGLTTISMNQPPVIDLDGDDSSFI